MDHDKIYDQIKSAAQNAESKDFGALDKVWARVEDKLDRKALKRQNRRYKMMAAAASVLLIVSLGYQFFKPQGILIEPKNQIVVADTLKIKTATPNTQTQAIVALPDTVSPEIRKDAAKVLQKQIRQQQQQIVASSSAPLPAATEIALVKPSSEAITGDSRKESEDGLSKSAYSPRQFESRSVGHLAKDKSDVPTASAKKQKMPGIQDPLVVVNGNAVQNIPASEALSQLDPEMIDSIEILKAPLYIINGVEYSEESLFGPHPTSPYAPLNKQEIESLHIYKDQEALARYGQKGAKGVVVITTKKK